MSDETNKTTDVNDIKERLRVEIPVEQESSAQDGAKSESKSDVVEELSNLGREFAATLGSLWNSEERQQWEKEVKKGVQTFVNEVDKVVREVRQGEASQKLRQEADNLGEQLKADDIAHKAKEGMVQGLRWLSEEMNNLAEQFAHKESAAQTKPAEPKEDVEIKVEDK